MRKTILAAVSGLIIAVGVAVAAPAYASETGVCKVLAGQHAYGWTNPDGSKVGVPSGKALLRELSADGVKGSQRQKACQALVSEHRRHHRH